MPCGFVALPSCHDKPNYHAGTVSTALLRVVRTPLQLTIWLNCLAQGLYRVPADQIQSTINRHVMQAGTHTYTQQREGGGGAGGNKDSQPQQTMRKQEEKQRRQTTGYRQREHTTKQAEQRKKKGGRGGRRSTQEPDPGTQKSKQRKAELATKQKHSSATTEAG